MSDTATPIHSRLNAVIFDANYDIMPSIRALLSGAAAEIEAAQQRITTLEGEVDTWMQKSVEMAQSSLDRKVVIARLEGELVSWKRVGEQWFGPEGRDLAIVDKAIQDEQAELRMLTEDNERLEGELAEARAVGDRWRVAHDSWREAAKGNAAIVERLEADNERLRGALARRLCRTCVAAEKDPGNFCQVLDRVDAALVYEQDRQALTEQQ